MTHLPELISDLALILIAAGVVTLLFRRLKQPVVLGYIIAGLVVGPAFPYLPSVKDVASVRIWAEIGVIFLLFALGLEFSFKKLARVGGSSTVTALTEIFAMVFIGYGLGLAFNWSHMDSLFLGGTLAISSTTIIIRAFDEMGVKSRGFVNLVFGVLIVEDLVAILLLVLLTTVAVTHTFAGSEMLLSITKLGFFLTLWFVGGIFLIPPLMKKIKLIANNETLLVISLGFCFLMVVLATKIGFSPALGAFIMGSLFAETSAGEKIEKVVASVKDLFAAIFFVSVGMMIDPALLMKYAIPVIVISIATIFGKALSTMLGALLAGQSLRHSVQSGMSLAQIGEFSFIIAALGLQLKVTSEFLYPIIVGVSAITTFTTPYLIKNADPLVAYLDRNIPNKWKNLNAVYINAVRNITRTTEWGKIIRTFTLSAIINSALITAVFLSTRYFLLPAIEEQFEGFQYLALSGLMFSIIISAPFIWALALRRHGTKLKEALLKKQSNMGPFLVLEFSRWLIAAALIVSLSTHFISMRAVTFVFVTAMGATVLLLSRYLDRIYSWFESRFISNLKERDQHHAESDRSPVLAPWDAHIAKLEVPSESQVLGLTLEELKVRERFGLTIALINRGQKKVWAPNRIEKLFPGDRLAVIGTDEQIADFKNFLIENEETDSAHDTTGSYSLHPYKLDNQSPYCGRTIRGSGIREKCDGLIVGLERETKRILNPDSNMKLEAGDLLWIVADDTLIQNLNQGTVSNV